MSNGPFIILLFAYKRHSYVTIDRNVFSNLLQMGSLSFMEIKHAMTNCLQVATTTRSLF